MHDYLVRGTARQGRIRVVAARTTEALAQMQQRHGTFPTATAALGRTVTAGVLIGAMMKGKEKVTIQVKGNGPLGQIVVDANAAGEVRGYVDHPHVNIPGNSFGKLDVSGAVGTEGYIHIIKDLGLKEPYRGSVPIVSGELGEDFTYYFAKSEQTPSAVALGVLVNADATVKASGGFILQLLPGIEDELISEIELTLEQLPPVTSLLEQGLSLEEIIGQLVPSFEPLEQLDVHFRCKCSRERVEQALISLGAKEMAQMIEEDGEAEIICHFCNETYRFNSEDLGYILEKIL